MESVVYERQQYTGLSKRNHQNDAKGRHYQSGLNYSAPQSTFILISAGNVDLLVEFLPPDQVMDIRRYVDSLKLEIRHGWLLGKHVRKNSNS